jgi:hypothetical protein
VCRFTLSLALFHCSPCAWGEDKPRHNRSRTHTAIHFSAAGALFCELEDDGALGMGFVYARCSVIGKLLLRSAVTKDKISSLESFSRLDAQLGQR